MRSGPAPQPKPVAPQRQPHVPLNQADYAGASSGNPTSVSLPLALGPYIPPVERVNPAAPYVLPPQQEGPSEPAAKRQKQVQLCSGCGFSTDGHARAKKGPNCLCLKNCRCRWCKRPWWHKLDGVKRGGAMPVRAGGGRRRTS